MKNLIQNAFALLAACAATACVSEKIDFGQTVPAGSEDTGYVLFPEGGLTVISDAEIVRSAETPDVDTFLCSIVSDETDETVQSFAYGDRPTEPIALKTGSYRLLVSSGTVPELEWESPVYGAEQPFSIVKGATTTLADVKCRLANIKVTVGYDADLKTLLEEGSQTTVTIGANSMPFPYTEERAAYFKAAAEENDMAVEMELTLAGKTSKMTQTVSGVKAGQWRKITVNMPHVNEGNVVFDITIETLTLDEEIVVDVATIQLMAEEVISEDPVADPLAPSIVWEGHDLSQTTRLVASMFDEEGNCIIPFAIDVAVQDGATIQSFVVDINSTSNGFMESLASMNIDRNFDLCEVNSSSNPTLNTALKMIGFPTGTSVQGKSSVSFDLQKVIGMLYSFDGTHVFSLTVTDSEGRTSEAVLSLLVDKDNENETAGPVIEWVDNDISVPHEVTSDLQVAIRVTAPAGIRDFTVDIVSDVLTEEALEGMLPTHIDLVNPGDVAENLSGLGFPVGEKVTEAKDGVLNFDITDFMPALIAISGGSACYANFVMNVTDNNGQSCTETLQLLINQ